MVQEAQSKEVIVYADATGKEPFTDWLYRLRDARARRRILQRLSRLQSGNFGDHKAIRDGVSELRFTFGPGYRVYYGEHGDRVVILLCGGDKGSQAQDIKNAAMLWKEYLSHE